MTSHIYKYVLSYLPPLLAGRYIIGVIFWGSK